MESFDFPKQTSAPSLSKSSNKKDVSKTYSSVTHPSICHRSREHLQSIFKKINSGDNVLSRIPTRLDPNVEFSDDEDEEAANTVIKRPIPDSSEGKSNLGKINEKENQKNFLAEIMKTPEFPHKPQFASSSACCTREKRASEIMKNHHDNILSSHSSVSKANFWGNLNKSNKPSELSNDTIKLFVKPNEDIPPTISKQVSCFSSNKDAQCTDITVKNSNDVKNFSSLSDDAIEVNGKLYKILSLLGSGGSCKVYSVYDTQNKARIAIKRVNLKETDPLIRKGYEQEIEYLRKLQNSNRVIKMYDFEYRENELLIVLEHGDIDLSKYLSNEAKLKRLTPLKIKFYWAQMLEAVADIHKYGIVHSDLKPANFLLVEGNLKLIDFGIATSVPEDKTSTFRDTQVGTLNYMSPEAITQMSGDSKQPCFKIGVKSDVWSLGCILYNLVYGVTPFHSIKSLMQKIYAITNPNYEIPFKPVSDPLLLDVLKLCLKRDPKERASVEQLLKHPYLAEENTASTNTVSEIPNPDLQNVLKQMQSLTPRRMRYVTKVLQELSGKPNT